MGRRRPKAWVSTTTRRRVALPLVAVLGLAALAALTACGGGGGEEEPAPTTPAAETRTQAPTVERPTPTPEISTPAAATSPRPLVECDALLTDEEADEVLDEFVTGLPSGPGFCQWETDSGSYLRIELGSSEDFQAGLKIGGVTGEPVPGVGDEAVWFSGAQIPSQHFRFEEETVAVGILSVRQDNFYFRIILNLPEVDSATQLDIAKNLATKAIEPLS